MKQTNEGHGPLTGPGVRTTTYVRIDSRSTRHPRVSLEHSPSSRHSRASEFWRSCMQLPHRVKYSGSSDHARVFMMPYHSRSQYPSMGEAKGCWPEAHVLETKKWWSNLRRHGIWNESWIKNLGTSHKCSVQNSSESFFSSDHQLRKPEIFIPTCLLYVLKPVKRQKKRA